MGIRAISLCSAFGMRFAGARGSAVAVARAVIVAVAIVLFACPPVVSSHSVKTVVLTHMPLLVQVAVPCVRIVEKVTVDGTHNVSVWQADCSPLPLHTSLTVYVAQPEPL